MIADIFEFLGHVWQTIGAAMRLNPRVFEIVETMPNTRWILLAIVLLGGASLLLGQSAILFVNRVRPARFVLSLFLSGFLFYFNLLIWALCIWATSFFFVETPPDASAMVRLVALGAAPYIYGFLILMPYLGNFVDRLLSVWSFLVVLAATMHALAIDFVEGLVVVGLGWLLVRLLSATIGRPLGALRRALARAVTGSQMDARMQDILMQFVDEQPTQEPVKSQSH